ncbi:potassium voltage-gated channel subfamily KQT member 1 isoform X4 [Hyaena hyaena]|uniref:potassium voltage-gated channel subfamily KQT member 1 isoform X4 n=1 Tax=Hyaena hyaena TaxID=95912 RepID=UPI0019224701|nr:potassium voltage-gated channel subfamily KQT member 1 isoform X4 [Hyaena hyaena]
MRAPPCLELQGRLRAALHQRPRLLPASLMQALCGAGREDPWAGCVIGGEPRGFHRTGDRAGGVLRDGVRGPPLVGRLPQQVRGRLGTAALRPEAHLHHRPHRGPGLHGRPLRGLQRAGVCHLCHQGHPLPPDSEDAACRSPGRHLEAAGLCGLHPPAGAHHHLVHRLPGPHLLLVLRVPGREGRRERVGPSGVWQLRGCSVVGGGHGHHHRLRGQGAPDVGREDHRLLLLRVRHLFLRAPSGDSRLWLRPEGPAEAEAETLQQADSSSSVSHSDGLEVLRGREPRVLHLEDLRPEARPQPHPAVPEPQAQEVRHGKEEEVQTGQGQRAEPRREDARGPPRHVRARLRGAEARPLLRGRSQEEPHAARSEHAPLRENQQLCRGPGPGGGDAAGAHHPRVTAAGAPSGHHQGHSAHAVLCGQEEIPASSEALRRAGCHRAVLPGAPQPHGAHQRAAEKAGPVHREALPLHLCLREEQGPRQQHDRGPPQPGGRQGDTAGPEAGAHHGLASAAAVLAPRWPPGRPHPQWGRGSGAPAPRPHQPRALPAGQRPAHLRAADRAPQGPRGGVLMGAWGPRPSREGPEEPGPAGPTSHPTGAPLGHWLLHEGPREQPLPRRPRPPTAMLS